MLQITTNNINLYVEFVDAPLDSLRSRRLEVVGTRKKRVRKMETCEGSVSLVRTRSLFHPLPPGACYAG